MAITSERIDILVVYDVETKTAKGKRRWRRICQLCKDYGQRVQFSVFECSVSRAQLEAFEALAIDCIDGAKDSLRIYVLQGGRTASLKAHGVDRYKSYDEPLIL